MRRDTRERPREQPRECAGPREVTATFAPAAVLPPPTLFLKNFWINIIPIFSHSPLLSKLSAVGATPNQELGPGLTVQGFEIWQRAFYDINGIEHSETAARCPPVPAGDAASQGRRGAAEVAFPGELSLCAAATLRGEFPGVT